MPVSRCNAAGFRLLLGLALLVSTIGMLTPGGDTPLPFPHADKLWHAAGFAVLGMLADLSWPEQGFEWPKWLPLLAYGGVMEGVQSLVPRRSAEFGDLLADAAGLLIYGLLIALLMRRLHWR